MRAFALIPFLAFAGCDSAGDRLGAEITLRDLDGDVLTTGTLTFDEPIEAGANVSGSYRLEAAPTPSFPASGSLQASCEVGPKERDDLSIVLDTSISLQGTCAEGLRGGEWRIFGTAPLPAGTYELR